MEFPVLPWFVREDIIKLVIEEEPKYCSINKEWLRLVAAKHGLISIGPKPPGINKSITLFTPHIKKLEFTRESDIDWDCVYSHKNVTHAYIKISFIYRIPAIRREFITKLLHLPPLRSLEIYLCSITKSDFSQLIKNNKLHLKRLKISILDQVWERTLKKTMLPNLVHLDLVNLCPSDIQLITKGMPSLKSLRLAFERPEESILFEDFELPNLIKLDLNKSYRQVRLKVNLANLPKLKSLILMGDIELIGKHALNNIEELQTDNMYDNFLDHVCLLFLKLTTLDMKITDDLSPPKLWNYLLHLTTLRRLRLNIDFLYFFKDLPPGSYFITDLTLDGKFYTTPRLLIWLDTSFSLQKLDIYARRLRGKKFQHVTMFEQLRSLKIRARSEFHNLFTQSFNKRTHPHINYIEITSCDCDE